MNHLVRNLILFCLVVVFLIVGGYLIITAQGLVFDFKNLRITKTGGIYLKFTPADAILKINEKLYPSPHGLLNNAVFIKNLLPGEYRITVSKTDYFSWEKDLLVQKGFVTSATKIILWPKNFTSESAEKGVEDFWLTNKGLIYKGFNQNLYFKKQLLRGETVILNDPTSNFIVTTDKKSPFLIDLQNSKASINLNELFNSLKQQQLGLPGNVPIKKFFVHPFSQGKILIMTKSSFYVLDYKRVALERLLTTSTITAGAISNNEAFFADNRGNLLIYNLILKNSEVVNLNLPLIEKIKSNPDGDKILILSSDNELFFYNRSSKKLESISKSARDFYFSPEQKRVALIGDDGKIIIFYIANYESDEKKMKGSAFTLPPQINTEAPNFYWLEEKSDYLSVLSGTDLIISELDSRSPINRYKIFENVKKYFIQENEASVLTNDGTLVRLNLAL